MTWIRLFPVLAQLRPVFPRKVTFLVFVTAVIGFMVRTDQRGVTSIIRALDLKPAFYKSLLRFFRSRATPASLPKHGPESCSRSSRTIWSA